MKQRTMLPVIAVLAFSLMATSCGKKGGSSSSKKTSTVTTPTTPTTPTVTNNGSVTTMEALVTNFNSVTDVAGLTSGQIISFTSINADETTFNNDTFQGILDFLNINTYTTSTTQELIKVENVNGVTLTIRSGQSIYTFGNPIVYSKSGDADLNLILSQHNGAATVVLMKAAKVYTNQNDYKNATYIEMTKNNKLYSYVVSSEMPLISNPVFSYDGSTEVTKQLNGVAIQINQ